MADAQTQVPVQSGPRWRRLLPAAERPDPRRVGLAALAAVVIFLTVWWPAYLQVHTYGPVGIDSYFHIRYTRIMREQGPLRKLPWLYWTIRRDHFRDHHFLYHVLLIPFTYGDLRIGAKVAASIFASASLLVFLFVATRRERLLGLLATLLLMGASSHFMFRLCLTRVMSLALLSLLLGMHLALTRRYKLLGLLAFLYVLLYDGAVLLLIFCALHTLVLALRERRFEWRLIVAVLVGFALGYVVNPYFPDNVRWLVFNVKRVAGGLQTEYPTGSEWQPLQTWTWIRFAPAVWAAMIATGLLLLHRGRPAVPTTSILLMTVVMVLAGAMSRRYVLYWAPLGLLFSVHGLADWARGMQAPPGERAPPRRRRIPARALAAALLVLLLPGAGWGAHRSIAMIESTSPYQKYMGSALWLKQHSKPGEIVFNVDWDAFPRLFFFNAENYYVVGLDLLYLVRYDQGLYNLHRNIARGNVAQPSRVLRSRFNARYLLGPTDQIALVQRCDRDPGLIVRYLDPWNYIYEVLPEEAESPSGRKHPRNPLLGPSGH
jgi:hypothetical protein